MGYPKKQEFHKINLNLCLLDKKGNLTGRVDTYWNNKSKPVSSSVKGSFNGENFYFYEPTEEGNGEYKDARINVSKGAYEGKYYYYGNYKNHKPYNWVFFIK